MNHKNQKIIFYKMRIIQVLQNLKFSIKVKLVFKVFKIKIKTLKQ
jgi:hypothetical protein